MTLILIFETEVNNRFIFLCILKRSRQVFSERNITLTGDSLLKKKVKLKNKDDIDLEEKREKMM